MTTHPLFAFVLQRRGEQPTGQQRRKHQITYLIHQVRGAVARIKFFVEVQKEIFLRAHVCTYL